jgi:hypothetical protein
MQEAIDLMLSEDVAPTGSSWFAAKNAGRWHLVTLIFSV